MDNNLLIYFNYKSEISAIEKMLTEIPVDFVIDRIGLEYRMKRLLQKISDFELVSGLSAIELYSEYERKKCFVR